MKKPDNFDLKEWLCDNCIVGLKVHYYQTGTDTSDTDWELIPSSGKSKRVKGRSVDKLVDVSPDWNSVLRPKDTVSVEVRKWKDFSAKEAKDLAEYERLKSKFS